MASHEEKQINRINVEIENLEEEKKFFYILAFFKQTKELMTKIGIEHIDLSRGNGQDSYKYTGLKFKYQHEKDHSLWGDYKVNQAFETFNIKMPDGWYIVQDTSSLKANEIFNFKKDLLFDEFLKQCFPPEYAFIFLNDKIEKQLPVKDEPEARKMKI